jgi:hypothetical protein
VPSHHWLSARSKSEICTACRKRPFQQSNPCTATVGRKLGLRGNVEGFLGVGSENKFLVTTCVSTAFNPRSIIR